ncbi:hypothetical protein [Agrobacterium rosae]|uniref:hypothetical protein n=1 Tax=Agrobacterium rosae TaxID=1972867 RepID=UPI003A80A722
MAYASRRLTLAPERIEALPRRLVGRRPAAMQQSQTSSAAMCEYAPAAGQNRCAMEIDGERVLVDVGSYNLKGERAVVLRHNGTIGIEVVEIREDMPNRHLGPRSAYGPKYKSPDGFVMTDCVTVIGKIIEPEIFHGVTIDGEAA